MADEYKIQVNTNIQGDLVNIRAQSGEELAETVGGFATHAGTIFKELGDVKQAALVHGVFTGGVTSTPATPPRSAAATPPGAVPQCPEHGQAKDMRGKRKKDGTPYQYRYYCSKFGCQTFKGEGQWIE